MAYYTWNSSLKHVIRWNIIWNIWCSLQKWQKPTCALVLYMILRLYIWYPINNYIQLIIPRWEKLGMEASMICISAILWQKCSIKPTVGIPNIWIFCTSTFDKWDIRGSSNNIHFQPLAKSSLSLSSLHIPRSNKQLKIPAITKYLKTKSNYQNHNAHFGKPVYFLLYIYVPYIPVFRDLWYSSSIQACDEFLCSLNIFRTWKICNRNCNSCIFCFDNLIIGKFSFELLQ